ncbi:MAG: ROK family glucokinase [candidate division NC10 bacterium]|nr:ROK family glucokinase [candidate division NC10 bacterium]
MIAAIGVDLGATNVRLVLVDQNGAVMDSGRFPVPERGRAEPVLEDLAPAIEAMRERAEGNAYQVGALGVGVAGLTDVKEGIVLDAINLGWKEVPFQSLLEERLKLPVLLENDANATAFAEAWVGAGRGCRSLISLTLGTGVGGGLIFDGELWRGASGLAGEIGHMVVEPDGEPCHCGGRGCLEAYISASAVVRDAKKAILDGKVGEPLSSFMGNLEGLTAKDVSDAASKGDPLAKRILAKAGRYLGVACTSLIHIFNPEMIVVGGGMAQAGELILGPARVEVKERAFGPLAESTRIALSPLGELAGAIGVAGLALRRYVPSR